MSPSNTVLHYRLFKGVIARAGADGEDAALSLLYAATAAARAVLGADRVQAEVELLFKTQDRGQR